MICNMYVRIVAFVVWFSKSHFLKKKISIIVLLMLQIHLYILNFKRKVLIMNYISNIF